MPDPNVLFAEVAVIKGLSCYGSADAVARIALRTNPDDVRSIDLIRVPDDCSCERDCIKPCKTIHDVNTVYVRDFSVDNSTFNDDTRIESVTYIFDKLRAGRYSIEVIVGDTTYVSELEVKESIKLETFGKPATAPWNAQDGAIEGVVYGTTGRYRVSLYVGYEFASLSSLADAAAATQLVPGSITALIGKNEEFVSNFLSRYTAAYSVNTWVDDANGGRFAFGALKPGQYTVVVEADVLNGGDADASVWVQSATATVKVGVDYVATAFRLLALVVSLAVFTWLFRHLYSLLIDILDDLLPKFVK
jgi:uncharacterized protein (DUF2141 family)